MVQGGGAGWGSPAGQVEGIVVRSIDFASACSRDSAQAPLGTCLTPPALDHKASVERHHFSTAAV